MEVSYPPDLAKVVHGILRSRQLPRPRLTYLADMLNVMYQASFRTEEAKRIEVLVCYVDPRNPEPLPPLVSRFDKPHVFPLTERVPFTVEKLVKIARATDSRNSGIAVFPEGKKNQLTIWGIVDQALGVSKLLTLEGSGGRLPGLLQVSITGPGQLLVNLDAEQLAELRDGQVRTHKAFIWDLVPFTEYFHSWIHAFSDEIIDGLGESISRDKRYLTTAATICPFPSPLEQVSSVFYNTLGRLLIRIKMGSTDGATILITPKPSSRYLKVKYKLEYERIQSGMRHSCYATISQEHHRWEAECAPDFATQNYHLKQTDSLRREIDDAFDELDGALWCASAFARIDGAVILSPMLSVSGFGAEILSPRRIGRCYLHSSADFQVTELDPTQFGTRHRSAIRYASLDTASLVIVYSHDGDVRLLKSDSNGDVHMLDSVDLISTSKSSRLSNQREKRKREQAERWIQKITDERRRNVKPSQTNGFKHQECSDLTCVFCGEP